MIWSDARRAYVLGPALAVLFALTGGYAAYATWVPQGWEAARAAPGAWDGAELLLPLFTVEAIEGPDRYVLRQSSWRVPVEGPTADLRVGRDLSVRGRFRAADGAVVETWREHAPLRGGKRALGVGAIVVFALLAPSFFARRDGRWVSRA